jgi:hypothetical protein
LVYDFVTGPMNDDQIVSEGYFHLNIEIIH